MSHIIHSLISPLLCVLTELEKAYVSSSCSSGSSQGRGKPSCHHWILGGGVQMNSYGPTARSHKQLCVRGGMLLSSVCFQIYCLIGFKVTLVALVCLFCCAHWLTGGVGQMNSHSPQVDLTSQPTDPYFISSSSSSSVRPHFSHFPLFSPLLLPLTVTLPPLTQP